MGLLNRLLGRGGLARWRTETAWLHELGATRPPEAVQWIATSACDLTCPHCYSHAGRPSAGELSTDEACRLIVDELVTLGRPTLVIAGGEALLRRDLPEIVAYAHERGVPWALHTHGGHASYLAETFRAHPPIMAAISVDGPPEYHDAFRGRVGSFDAAMAAIALLKDAGCPEVVAGMTVHRGNADRVLDTLPYILASEVDSWGLHLVTPEGRADAGLLPTPRQLRRVATIARRLRSFVHVELDNEWGSAGDDDAFYRDTRFTCGAGRFSCVVSATGELMPCTTTDASESQGNVRERPLSVLWREGFGAFRGAGEDPLRGEVLDCWLQTRNGCSCRGAAFRGEPSIEALPPAVRPPSFSLPRPAGRASRMPGVARAAVTALMALGVGWRGGEARADGPERGPADGARKAESQVPEWLTAEVVRRWMPTAAGDARLWPLKRALLAGDALDARQRRSLSSLRLPAPLLQAVRGAEGVTPAPSEAELARGLEQARRAGVIDPWLVSYVWRQLERAGAAASEGERAGRLAVHRELVEHARAANALVRAYADAGPIPRRAWMSKAGPGRMYRAKAKQMGPLLRKHYARAGLGTWSTDGRVELSVIRGALTRTRGGSRVVPDGAFEVGRLDVLEATDGPVVLQHGLGLLTVPEGRAVSAWELHGLLSEAGVRRVRERVAAALGGDVKAADEIEAALPLTWSALRKGLAERPEAPLAARLRMALATFDEHVARKGDRIPEGKVPGRGGK